MIRTRITGDNLIDLADEILDETIAPVKAVAEQAGGILLADVQRRLRTRSGETAPEGEAPAYQSGDLLNSFRRLPVRVKENTVTSGIESSEPFGKVNGLEYGRVTPEGKQVKARPFLRPAEEAVQSKVDALAESLL